MRLVDFLFIALWALLAPVMPFMDAVYPRLLALAILLAIGRILVGERL